MRKTLFFFLLAFLAAGCAGDIITYQEDDDPPDPVTPTLTDPGLAWSAASCEAVFGGDNVFPTLTNPFGVAVSYSSSSSAVATISSDGAITLVAGGSTTISASSEENEEYSASSASYTLTVNLAEGRLSWSDASATATLGEENTFPALDNPNALRVSYSSSDESVATISPEGGVNLVSAGVTTITASSEGTSTHAACSVSYTLTVNKSSEGISWSAESCTVTIGAQDNTFPSLLNPGQQDVTYSSSDPGVATISPSGEVVPVGGGTAVITAVSAETPVYNSRSVSYTLTVNKISEGISWSADDCTVTIGASDNSFPSLSNPGRQDISYSSSDTDVATISAAGEVVPVGGGTAVITAVSAETPVYNSRSVSYILTVNKISEGISWSADDCTVTIGASNNVFPTLNNPGGQKVTYSSSNADVATVASDGSVSLLSEGFTSIIAYSEESAAYYGTSVFYTLEVLAEGSNLVSADLSWSSAACSATMGDTPDYPILNNPHGLNVSYNSSNEDVATISADGTVILVTAGSTTITASSEKDDTYAAGSASYILSVRLAEPGLSWSASRCSAIMGGTPDYPVLNNPHGLKVSYSSSDKNVATVSADGTVTLVTAGSATITATSEATKTYSAGSVSYTLDVSLAEPGLSWSASRYSATMGGMPDYPVLNNPHGLKVSYGSSDKNVATVSADGTVTLVTAGSTTITATSEATKTYSAGSVSYTLDVALADAVLSWSEGSCTATLASDDNVFPTLDNPCGLEITYSSSNTSVATIGPGGTVIPVAAGTATIVASSAATAVYAAGSASYTLNVVKHDLTLSWSENACSVVLGGTNTFPTLSVTPSGADIGIEYSSSDASVATISTDGIVTPVAAGTAVISATFAGNDIYKSAAASYTLTVSKRPDEGSGTFKYPSTGDASSEDDISNTTFTRMITITYSSNGATVTGDDNGIVSVEGNYVTANNSGTEAIVYKLTGNASYGSFKLYSTKKQAILLSDLTLTNPSGAAINNQSGKRTFVMVEGTNTLSDAMSADYATVKDEDMKAVLFSEGQLVFSGSGSLTVTAKNYQGKSCIVSDDYVRVMESPDIKVTSGSLAGHGIRGKDYVRLSGGSITVSTSAAMKKGVASDDYVLVEGGTHSITVKGGVDYDDDEAEYKGTAGVRADNYFAMTGGSLTIKNTGAGGKGVSAGSYTFDSKNHTLSDSYISGGILDITTSGSESYDVSSKGIKIGYKQQLSGKNYAYAGNLKISGGIVKVNCSKSEGIEAKGNLTFDGGQTYAVSYADDAINCQGEMNVNAGYIYAYSTKNDALDSNGDMKINGGFVFAVTTNGAPEVALDANTEGGYKLYINSGATVVAYGGLEGGYSASQSIYSMTCSAGAWNALYGGGSFIAAFKAPANISTFAVSAPSLSNGYKDVSVSGETYCDGLWVTEGISGGTEVTLSTYTGGGGGPGGPGGPGGGGRPPGW